MKYYKITDGDIELFDIVPVEDITPNLSKGFKKFELFDNERLVSIITPDELISNTKRLFGYSYEKLAREVKTTPAIFFRNKERMSEKFFYKIMSIYKDKEDEIIELIEDRRREYIKEQRDTEKEIGSLKDRLSLVANKVARINDLLLKIRNKDNQKG